MVCDEGRAEVKQMKKVFTFWEPKEKVPGYVRLCMETWRGCLPGYETVVLDYGSLGDWLTKEEQNDVLCKKMTFAMQSDCIRCAVLKKHGGIWMDADTVLVKPLDERFSAADCAIVARRQDGHLVHYAAYINAARPEAKFLADWHRELVPRVARARKFRSSWLTRFLHHGEWKLIRRWNYCVNAIIDPLADTADSKDYAWIDKDAIFAVPEEELMVTGLDAVAAYQKYWFEPGEIDDVLKRCAGMIMLHNSFTPERFRVMSSKTFLATDTRLAALLRHLLKIKATR